MNKNKLPHTKETHLYKNTIRIFITLIFLIMIVGGILFMSTTSSYNNECKYRSIDKVGYIKNTSDILIQNINMVLYRIASEKYTQLMFYTYDIEEFYSPHTKEIYEEIRINSNSYDSIRSIYIYTEYNDTILSCIGDEYSPSAPFKGFEDKSWMREYKKLKNNEKKVYVRDYTDNNNKFLTFILKFDTHLKKGAVIINTDINTHMSFTSGNEMVLWFDDNKQITYKNKITNEFAEKIINAENNIFKYDNIYYASAKSKSDYGWEYYCVSELKNYMSYNIVIFTVISVCMIILIVIGFFVSFKLAEISYKPLRSIANILNKPVSDETRRFLDNDEVTKYIADGITSVMHANFNLKKEIEERNKEFNNTQLLALQFQINPHFLSNTLGLFYLISSENLDEDHILSKGIMSLSKTLRYSTDTSEVIIPLETELSMAEEYLNIMKMRTKTDVHINFNIPDELKKKGIVKMSLQPIFENSFQHGFKNKDTLAAIDVSARKDKQFFYLEITDNGVGITQEMLSEIKAVLNKGKASYSRHIGLENVQKRIQILYGDEYGLSIESEPNNGTKVVFKYPNDIKNQ